MCSSDLSQQFFSLASVTGTKIEIQAPAFENLTAHPAALPVSIQTLAGLSNSTNATYAGVPTVSAVQATAGPTAGKNAGPATGGTPIEIDGSGRLRVTPAGFPLLDAVVADLAA